MDSPLFSARLWGRRLGAASVRRAFRGDGLAGLCFHARGFRRRGSLDCAGRSQSDAILLHLAGRLGRARRAAAVFIGGGGDSAWTSCGGRRGPLGHLAPLALGRFLPRSCGPFKIQRHPDRGRSGDFRRRKPEAAALDRRSCRLRRRGIGHRHANAGADLERGTRRGVLLVSDGPRRPRVGIEARAGARDGAWPGWLSHALDLSGAQRRHCLRVSIPGRERRATALACLPRLAADCRLHDHPAVGGSRFSALGDAGMVLCLPAHGRLACRTPGTLAP